MRTFLFLLSVVAWAAGPNFSGSYQLNVGKSTFANQEAPKSRVVRIDHHPPLLTIGIEDDDSRGKVSHSANYTTDGKENVNDVYGNPMKAVTRIEGRTIVMRTTGSFNGNEIKLDDRWELSPDGKTLTLRRHFEGQQRGGVQDQVQVFERIQK
jgi:hypothetical protein